MNNEFNVVIGQIPILLKKVYSLYPNYNKQINYGSFLLFFKWRRVMQWFKTTSLTIYFEFNFFPYMALMDCFFQTFI
jgi:hypothetical protein